SCPRCDQRFKLPEEKAGGSIVCPRCGVPTVAPAAGASETSEARRLAQAQGAEQAQGLFQGMSSRVRWAVVLAAVAGACGLLLPTLSLLPVPRDVAASAWGWAVPLVACSVVSLLAVLYGHATGCPACGKLWSRAEVATSL